jgi:hypothetical protein
MIQLDIRKNHFGILTSIDWNSNNWQDVPTDEDLLNSSFGYAIDNEVTYTFMNFGFDPQSDGENFHSALCPHIYSRLPDPEKRDSVKIIFIRSKNYHDNKNYLIGYFSFPKIHHHEKPSPNLEFCDTLHVCLESKIKDIVFFDNFIDLEEFDRSRILPQNRQYGRMGYNYLTVKNSLAILDTIDRIRPNMSKHRTNKMKLLQYVIKNNLEK